MTGARPLLGPAERQVDQALIVLRGEPSAVIVHHVEPAQLRATDSGLDLVEAQVEADLRVHVLIQTTMIPQPTTAGGDLIVVSHHRAPVPHDGEVL